MTTCYKLTTQDQTTHNDCKWKVDVPKETSGVGELCSPAFLHAYTSPLLAVLLNPIHAAIENPKLFLAEGSGVFKSDKGLKVGYSKMTLVEEIVLPVFTTEQRVAFAILCSLKVYKEQSFVAWAENWLEGSDRSRTTAEAAARAAARAARAAWTAWAAWAAAEAAAGAAWAAAGAAESAACSAEIAEIDLDLIALAEKTARQF